MKARINFNDKVSNKQKEAVREFVRQECKNMMRRFFKMMCFVLNDEYGFGRKRLLKVIDGINKISEVHMEDEEFWYHLDKRIIEQMNIPFEREKYEEIDYGR